MAEKNLSQVSGTRTRSSVVGTDWIYLLSSGLVDYKMTATEFFTLTGDVTAGIDGVTTIGAGKVLTANVADDNVTFAKIQNIDTDHILCRSTSGTGDVEAKKISELDAHSPVVSTTLIPGETAAGNLVHMTAADLLALASSTARTVNAQTGTTYTVQESDVGNIVTLDNAAAITVTVPDVIGEGEFVDFKQLGAGQVTFVGSGYTINTPETLKIEKQYAPARIEGLGSSAGILSGQLELAP